jgi:SAM-dependent methyltransferase
MIRDSHTGVVPLTPAPLMEIANGFRIAKVLSVALEMGLFTKLSGTQGTTVEELAADAGISVRPAKMMLVAAASLGLLDKRDGRYHNSELSEEFLVVGKKYFFGDLVRFVDRREYEGWGKLEEAVRGNRPTTWDPDAADTVFLPEDQQMLGLFWRALFSAATFTARSLALSVDFSRFRRLLDVGGGSGAFSIELCRRHPGLAATVFDQPFVCEMADKNIAEADLTDRVDSHSGDFFTERLPSGRDAILLSDILHDWSPEQNLAILKNCYAALEPGGTLVVSEAFVNDEGTGPVGGALASINMLIETVDGANYSRAEYEELLTQAGFRDLRRVGLVLDTAGSNGVLLAHKNS